MTHKMYYTVQDDYGDIDLIEERRNRGTLNVSVNMAEEIVNSLNNWREVKRLFLATDDTDEIMVAISRMIQEEAKS